MNLPLFLFLAGLALTPLGFFLAWKHGNLVLDVFDLWQADHSLREAVGLFCEVAGFVTMVLGPLALVGGTAAMLRKPDSKPPSDSATLPSFKPRSGCMGVFVGAIVGAVMGFIYAVMTIVPGSAAGLEVMGYFAAPVEGAVVGILAAWLGGAWLFPKRRRGRGRQAVVASD